MPELMINVGWTEAETANHYKPRFLHALNAISECKQDKPLSIADVVVMMDKPTAFNPTKYKTVRDAEADGILTQIVNELRGGNYLSKRGYSLFATEAGLEKRKATEPYWKRTSNEIYDCDEDKPKPEPFELG